MKHVKYLIIGAGPAGLGAAYRLNDLQESDYLVVEKEPWVGGLSGSFTTKDAYTWDIGGHVLFSHFDYFDKAMAHALSEDEWLEHERESWIWILDRFVPYPFQNNIRYLPKQAMLECLKGALAVTKQDQPERVADFGEWILATFGEGIAKYFMLPYNYKVWAYPPRDLAYHWIGERVSVVDGVKIAKNILFNKDDIAWGPNNKFSFPKHGGTGAIWQRIAAIINEDRIQRNTTLCSVSTQDRIAKFSDGSTISYDNLLSTIPLNLFCSMVEESSEQNKKAAQGLKYSSSNVIGIGLKGQPHDSLKTKCWMYFPEEDCPFYRTTLFSNYSPNNVPDANTHFSLMTEVSESPVKHVARDKIVEDSIQGLQNTKLVRKEHDIVHSWSFFAEYGYPIPCNERDRILKPVIEELDSLEAYSRGRFGGWKYEVGNQDHSFMQGVEWVNWVLKGEEEKIYSVD